MKTDPSHYYWDDETTKLFERIAGRDISYRCRSKKCNSCGEQFTSVEMSWMFLSTMIKEIKRLGKEIEQLQIEKERLEIEVEIETNEGEELRIEKEKLEKEVGQSQAELDCIKEALLRISDLAIELGTRKQMSQYVTGSPNKILQLTEST